MPDPIWARPCKRSKDDTLWWPYRINITNALQRENNAYTQSEGIARAWSDYFELIEKQNEDRANDQRMVREGCVIGFMADLSTNPALAAEYEKGGKCYYGNK